MRDTRRYGSFLRKPADNLRLSAEAGRLPSFRVRSLEIPRGSGELGWDVSDGDETGKTTWELNQIECLQPLGGRGVLMAVYVSHESALRYWLTKAGGECIPDSGGASGFVESRAAMAEIKRAALPFGPEEGRPLHVLVSDRNDVRSLKRVVTHLWKGPLPTSSFNELEGSSCVSSPEFTFLQMAARRPLWEVVRIGCYLCGCFAVGDESGRFAGARAALTTPESILDFVASVPGAYGANRARSALPYVVPYAASPIEVLLCMAFSLPPQKGGWSMPGIEANQRIEVDGRLHVLAGTDHYQGDIYLPSVKGDVEYDSYEFHTGRFRLDHTQTRRNVLEASGIKTVSATWGQISDFRKYETFLWMVKERFGIRQRAFSRDERAAQMELYANLTDPKIGLF